MTPELTLESQDWFVNLIEECKDIIVETGFQSRWTLIEGYHQLGMRILEDEGNFTKSGYTIDGMSSRVSTSLNRSQRTVERAIQFARMYPDLNLLNEGKNISWWKVINKYLTKGDKKGDECVHNPIVICSVCKKKLGDKYDIVIASEAKNLSSPLKGED